MKILTILLVTCLCAVVYIGVTRTDYHSYCQERGMIYLPKSGACVVGEYINK